MASHTGTRALRRLGAVALLSTATCTHVITTSDIGRLRMGMSPQETLCALGRPPVSEYRVSDSAGGEPSKVYTYALHSTATEQYLLVFDGDSLHFWGYPDEGWDSGDPFVKTVTERVTGKMRAMER